MVQYSVADLLAAEMESKRGINNYIQCESIAARTRMKDVGVNILIFAAFIFTQRLSKVAHNLTAVASAPSVVDNILCHIHCLTSP